MRKTAIFGLMAALLVMSSGCDRPLRQPSQIVTKENVVGVVEEVRVTAAFAQETQGSSGDSAVGAVAGGVVAGPIGAVVGAIIGSGNNKVTVGNKLLGCKLLVKLDKQTLAFTFGDYGSVEECSLQREGDKITIEKIVWSDVGLKYRWPDEWGGVSAEVFPE